MQNVFIADELIIRLNPIFGKYITLTCVLHFVKLFEYLHM